MKREKRFLLTCLMILCFLIASISLTEGEDMKRHRTNKLRDLHFTPLSSQLVGDCVSQPIASIRFWSPENGTLDNLVELHEPEFGESVAVSQGGCSSNRSDHLGCSANPEAAQISTSSKERPLIPSPNPNPAICAIWF